MCLKWSLAVLQEAAAVGQAGQEVAGGEVLQGADQLELVHVLRYAAEEFLARVGLAQEVVGAVLEEARDQRGVVVAGNADHRDLVARADCPQATGEFHALHAGHLLVDHGQADRRIGFHRLEPGVPVGGLDHLVAIQRQQCRGMGAGRGRVVHHQRRDAPVAVHALHQPHQVVDAPGRVLQHVVDDLLLQGTLA
jgi:hypothetical protein